MSPGRMGATPFGRGALHGGEGHYTERLNVSRPSGIGSGAAAAAATYASTAEAGASNRVTQQQQWVYEESHTCAHGCGSRLQYNMRQRACLCDKYPMGESPVSVDQLGAHLVMGLCLRFETRFRGLTIRSWSKNVSAPYAATDRPTCVGKDGL